MASVLAAVGVTVSAAPRSGDAAPDFAGVTFEGQRLSVASYSGKVVVLSFWATWCGPCRKELPILEGIARTAGPERVQVVAINIEAADVYRRVAEKRDTVQMLLAHDPASEARKSYGVDGIPHMVIIGKDGRIVRVHRGYTDAGVDQAIADLNRALGP